jgi:protein gp37
LAENSKIEWCDSTFNPWMGCTRISPACDHCYAAKSTPVRSMRLEWDKDRHRTAVEYWKLPLRWNRDAERFHAEHGRRQRVFCASLADVFDNEVPEEWRADLFRLIRETPNLDWLLLTKRIGNAPRMIDRALTDGHLLTSREPFWPWPNVWIGATIANQEEADRDVPKLLKTPAAVRFLSCEPLLGPIDLEYPEGVYGKDGPRRCCDGRECGCMGQPADPPLLYGIDWVIVGGESGGGARPMHPHWARSIRDQCDAAGVPFLFKQWGEWIPASQPSAHLPDGTMPRMYPFDNSTEVALRVGKKAAGRELYGRTWDQFPNEKRESL